MIRDLIDNRVYAPANICVAWLISEFLCKLPYNCLRLVVIGAVLYPAWNLSAWQNSRLLHRRPILKCNSLVVKICLSMSQKNSDALAAAVCVKVDELWSVLHILKINYKIQFMGFWGFGEIGRAHV